MVCRKKITDPGNISNQSRIWFNEGLIYHSKHIEVLENVNFKSFN